MPREREDYRPILEDILRFSEQRRLLSATEVAAYTGRDRRTVKKLYGIGAHGIPAPTLARLMAAQGCAR